MHVDQEDRIACLLEWCLAHEVRIDPRLEITENGETGISVFSRDEYISSPTTREFFLCRILSDTTQEFHRITSGKCSCPHSKISGALCEV